MSELATEIRKLTALKRTRANFDKIQDKLAELRDIVDTAGQIPDLIAACVSALKDLAEALGAVDEDNPLVPIGLDEVDPLISALPGGDLGDGEVTIGSLLDEAEGFASDYEEIKDDHEYDALARDEAWGALLDGIDNIANWLDPKGAPKNA